MPGIDKKLFPGELHFPGRLLQAQGNWSAFVDWFEQQGPGAAMAAGLLRKCEDVENLPCSESGLNAVLDKLEELGLGFIAYTEEQKAQTKTKAEAR